MKIAKYICVFTVALLSACSDPPVEPQPQASPWVAIAKGRIDIEGGIINIAASRPGIVRKVTVEDGADVVAGAILARIDDREARMAQQISERERDQVLSAADLLQKKVDIAWRESQRFAGLPDDTVVSNQERDIALDQWNLFSAELKQQKAILATAETRIAASRLEVDRHAVRAPLDGRVVRRQVRPGDGVSTLNVTPLFLFAPHGLRIVRADLEERYVDQVKPNQAAEVVLESDETMVYKAHVLRIGDVFGTRSASDDPAEKQDIRVIECVLAVEAPNLRIGQRVFVRFTRDSTVPATTTSGGS